jgi:hypothetical protein
MKTDRELLELAAKAAGIDQRKLPHAWPVRFDDDQWNPFIDDGDALRLAVHCGIEVSIVDDEPGRDGRDSRACAGYATASDPRIRYVFEDHRGDLFAATRRAIVRAAAEIGRNME